MRRNRSTAALASGVTPALLLLLAACMPGKQSMLDPAGPQAQRIDNLWAFITITAAVVYVVVIAALFVGAWRGRQRRLTDRMADESTEGETRRERVVAIAAAASVVLLFAYLIASVRTGQAIAAVSGENPIVVQIAGKQWWWDVTYRDTAPSKIVTTANELHIPVGRPVKVILTSTDVIHSFWVPNLHGKQDNIPGYKNVTVLRADRPGVYRAQCAEYCGHQHAHMALTVVAEPNEQFEAWYANQLAPAADPTDSTLLRGRQVFMTNSCVMCHAIAGTPAGSRVGPDLTHFASRRSIAAGTLPNTRGHLAGWVVDPQGIKPGTRMPANQLNPSDLNALLDYLRSLK